VVVVFPPEPPLPAVVVVVVAVVVVVVVVGQVLPEHPTEASTVTDVTLMLTPYALFSILLVKLAVLIAAVLTPLPV